MRTSDLLREAFRALGGSRTRTGLTALGITVGTMALTIILSLSKGLEGVIDSLVASDEQLRHVVVMPGFGRTGTDGDRKTPGPPAVEGEMTDLKRQRLQRAIQKRTRGGPPFQMRVRVIDAATEKALMELDGVESARPFVQERFDIEILGAPPPERDPAAAANAKPGAAPEPPGGLSLGVPKDHAYYPGRLVAGRWFTSDTERAVVVHELLLWRMGYTTDAAQTALVGKTVRLSARKANGGGGGLATLLLGMSGGGAKPTSEAPFTEDVVLAGVIRDRFGLERAAVIEEGFAMQADLFLPAGFARELWDRQPAHGGPQAMLITAKTVDDVQKIDDAVAAMGLEVRNVQEAVTAMKSGLSVMTVVASVLAGIALFVSALGIVNTLVMSVMERTREIGLLKALGATDGDVARLFLAEAAILGVSGGLLGTVLGWAMSLVGDHLGRIKIEEAFLMPFQGDLFVFPAWLAFAGVGFAVLVSVAAAILPTLRAARIDPVRALRHE